MRVETIVYESDVSLVGSVYLPENSKPAPGVVVFPDIFGLGDHARERATRLAEEGYVVLAADFHGGGSVLPVDKAMEELSRFHADPDVPCRRGEAALAQLIRLPGVDSSRIAAIGFCYGGTLALELARRGASLAAVVGFHSGLATTNHNGAKLVKSKILACIGSEDPAVPVEQRAAFEAEMRAADVDWQLHVYGGVYHTFTDWRSDNWGRPEFARYDAAADKRSWAAMRGLFSEAFGETAPDRI